MKTAEELMELASQAKAFAYAPYSGFQVGAALQVKSGRVFTGANVENASYGLTVCAERIAVFKAINAGERNFSYLAVVGSGNNHDIVYPCGACLQVLAEFAPDLTIYLINGDKILSHSLKELLPRAFGLVQPKP